MTIGIAVGAPWRGRRVDTVGLRRALIPSVVSEAVIWSVVPHVSYELLLPLVFVGGLLTLPIFSVVRQSLGVLATGEQRRTAFALDAISTELVFMIGPAAGALVATAGLLGPGADHRRRRHLGVRAVPDVVQPADPQRRACPQASGAESDAAFEASQQEGAEVAVVAAAPAHLQEAAAEFAPLAAAGERRQGRAGLRRKVIHNFAWFTAAVAAVFAVAAGAGMVLSGTDVGIVAALEPAATRPRSGSSSSSGARPRWSAASSTAPCTGPSRRSCCCWACPR